MRASCCRRLSAKAGDELATANGASQNEEAALFCRGCLAPDPRRQRMVLGSHRREQPRRLVTGRIPRLRFAQLHLHIRPLRKRALHCLYCDQRPFCAQMRTQRDSALAEVRIMRCVSQHRMLCRRLIRSCRCHICSHPLNSKKCF